MRAGVKDAGFSLRKLIPGLFVEEQGCEPAAPSLLEPAAKKSGRRFLAGHRGLLRLYCPPSSPGTEAQAQAHTGFSYQGLENPPGRWCGDNPLRWWLQLPRPGAFLGFTALFSRQIRLGSGAARRCPVCYHSARHSEQRIDFSSGFTSGRRCRDGKQAGREVARHIPARLVGGSGTLELLILVLQS